MNLQTNPSTDQTAGRGQTLRVAASGLQNAVGAENHEYGEEVSQPRGAAPRSISEIFWRLLPTASPSSAWDMRIFLR